MSEEQMLRHELLRDAGVLIVEPQSPLESTDFGELANNVDPYIEEKGQLKGLLIYAESFPGWEDFAAFLSHVKFIKNHHQKINRVAAVTDSGFLSILPNAASHFIEAEIRHFSFDEKEKALNWLQGSEV
jgi:hypothetical protein